MDHDIIAHRPAADPAAAFAELRGEVSLLRRAIEGLTDFNVDPTSADDLADKL